MPTKLPITDSKVEMLLEICKEEDDILQATFTMIDNQLTH